MSDRYWIGGAPAVAQKTTIQVTGYDVATTYKVTVGGIIISTIAGGSVNATATALAAAWNASVHPYAIVVTAAALTDTVTFTADTAGVPFVISSSVSGGGGTIGAATASVANSGPNDWSTAANWSGGVVPVNGDNVYLKNSIIPILWGLSQSGVTPALLDIDKTFSQPAILGLPYGRFSKSALSYDTTVPEYRQASLAIGAAIIRGGENYGGSNAQGSPLIKIDSGSTNVAALIYATGTPADNLPAMMLKMNHASATLKMYGGKVGLCWELPTDTGQISQADVYAGELYVGGGVTQSVHNQFAGKGVLLNVPTTVRSETGADLTIAPLASGGTVTTLEKRGNLAVAGQPFAVTNFKS